MLALLLFTDLKTKTKAISVFDNRKLLGEMRLGQ